MVEPTPKNWSMLIGLAWLEEQDDIPNDEPEQFDEQDDEESGSDDYGTRDG